jgi:hypothetical protein
MRGVFKIEFKFELRDLLPCRKTERRRAVNRGQAKIDDELDVASFIRFHL